jgi:hypothetical protein
MQSILKLYEIFQFTGYCSSILKILSKKELSKENENYNNPEARQLYD